MAADTCTECGACCAAFRVDFHRSELETAPGGFVPLALTVPVTATLVRMRGTDDGPPRCVALEGEVGRSASCSIYADRPSPCRDFAPYAALGIGDEGCARARRRHGMKPLDD
ncbi:MAG: YkgJ family cysteine cluster protein [Zoogloea sp.]|nr:YkgJ family cysteine cluster protein [Zoogloea sp.]